MRLFTIFTIFHVNVFCCYLLLLSDCSAARSVTLSSSTPFCSRIDALPGISHGPLCCGTSDAGCDADRVQGPCSFIAVQRAASSCFLFYLICLLRSLFFLLLLLSPLRCLCYNCSCQRTKPGKHTLLMRTVNGADIST